MRKSIRDIQQGDLFADSYVKMARAEAFIAELERELATYTNTPGKGWIDVNTREGKVEIPSITLLPGAIVGDAIHNLRTALDLMASELARIQKQDDADVYFPFAKSADAFDLAIKSRNFQKGGEDAVALLKTFAPYHGGNKLLRALHDLDIRDKHTSLVPTGSTLLVNVQFSYNVKDLADQTSSVSLADAHYIFPEGGIMGGIKVIETLKECMGMVYDILEAFGRLVESRSTTLDANRNQ